MKVLRIIGIVAFVHAFAFLLIMANPGCSTKPKPAPTPASTENTVSSSSPSVTVPSTGASEASSLGGAPQSVGAEPSTGISFDPNATAISVPRYSPTRPNTPASTALQAEPVADVTPATALTVGKGDSLWSIAKKHGIPVSDLAAANNLRTGATLRVGQKLVVPSKPMGVVAETSSPRESTVSTSPAMASKAASVEAPAAKASASGGVKHVVKPGETLAVIARKYGVKAGDIAVANNISNPAMLRAGKELVIPGWQTPKSAKAGAAVSEAAAGEAAPAQKAPAKHPDFVMPKIGLPSAEQDLDAGLKPATGNTVPVIKLDDNAPVAAPTN
ncbi:MAG: LysM peptidoglycan-binding domain-containing protein [Opitutaceae bacterium]|jgi:LysM repeat protein